MLHCRFNVTDVIAEFISPNMIACTTPQHGPGAVTVEISNNRQQFTTSGLTFNFEAVKLLSVHPHVGPVRGGTLATVSVRDFTAPLHASAFCHFGILSSVTVDASFDASGTVSCISPAVPFTGATTLSVSVSNATFISTLLFEFHEEPALQSLHPVMGPTYGGTAVGVFGTGFLSSSLWCKFAACGSQNVDSGQAPQTRITLARYISSTYVECMSPAVQNGFCDVSISANGQEPFSEDSLLFQAYQSIHVKAVIPPRGSVSGKLPVHVYGSGFSQRAAQLNYMRCRFGNVSSVAFLQPSGSEIVCQLPQGKPGFVPVEVTNNLLDYSRASAVTFEYTAVALHSAVPDNGPAVGSTAVTIFGTGFLDSEQYGTECIFTGDDGKVATAEAFVLSPHAVACVTPQSPAGGTAQSVALSLRISGQESLGFLLYHFLTTLHVETVHPMVGPVEGGTTLIIDGSHFSASSACQFANVIVPAQFVSSSRIRCVSPAHPIGHVMVTISSNNQNFFGRDDLFEYTPVIGGRRLMSVWPPRGPVDGGTFVSVLGDFFHERSASLFYLTCRFNVTSVPAIHISKSEVKCYSPEHAAGVVDVAVSNNLQDYVGGAYYEFTHFRLLRLDPYDGPVSGGTIVTIVGSQFAPGDLFCHFSQVGPSIGLKSTEVPDVLERSLYVTGSFISTSMIACIAPPARKDGGPALLRVVNSEAIYLSTTYFHYLQAPELLAIHPSRGPVHGGTVVTITGRGFVASMELLGLFDGSAVPLRILSETRLECETPMALAAGRVEVSTTNTHQSVRSHEPLEFLYDHPLHVISTLPGRGPAAGGTIVRVEGVFPDSPLTCSFNGTMSSASHLSSSIILCVAPPVGKPGYVSVEVNANMQDFSADGLLYEYQYARPVVLQPRQGPTAGGTQLTISGLDFLQSPCGAWNVKDATCSIPYCVFTPHKWLAATYVASDALVCNTPPVSTRGSAEVSVKYLNATLASSLMFVYHWPLAVSHVMPPLGPFNGGTRLQVFGSGFHSEEQLFCRFHARSHSQDPSLVRLVLARWRWWSPDSIECMTPPMAQLHEFDSMANSSHAFFVEVSQNGVNFSSSAVSYEYTMPSTVTYIEPRMVAAEGGAIITVHGSSISARAASLDLLQCAFDQVPSPATYLSNSRVTCTSPRALTSQSVVEISNNMMDFTGSGVALTVISIVLSSVIPSSGPAFGGTQMTITGAGLVPGAEWDCQLTGKDGALPLRFAATIMSASSLLCRIPAFATAWSEESAILQLVHDNVVHSAALLFLYAAPPSLP